ncbi:MAG: TetM/TetW/TetO/TetS family tetracycline resistance ribosomal protection protein [Roseburia sp.]|nr:TetM/TetW/TetO/TetS family tetracycline resistance ribosomal protection protein [Roseburia sp.]MCM1280163.1 TetM/TetW/TetO/TetS family tetracycline resistance ribosomal protection protein [Robinsoniella sp.]
MKQLTIGILAHVDAGKTTLSEAILYESGSIHSMGRVDKKNAFLDTHALEKERGITIFSKQAVFSLKDMQITLLDTPGHVDFSAEMERTLSVLDYAILVINGADGIQAHTRTLWQLLKRYRIPVFLFVNKMDQRGTQQEALLKQLKEKLDEGCMDFRGKTEPSFYENIAMCDEEALEQFLETEKLETEIIKRLIGERKLFPCFFGSALKLEGVRELLDDIEAYMKPPAYPEEFGARVFKIARDDRGNRLTFMKITGGRLKVRSVPAENLEKVTQIRIYSGEKYTVVDEAEAGTVCAVTGLSETRPGKGLGMEAAVFCPILEPVLTYQMKLPPDCDENVMLSKLEQLEEEQPELHILWDEQLKEIQLRLMGEVQIEIVKRLILERFGVEVEFGAGNIVYKETIEEWAEGVGHYEPLRHYAEVHLLLEAGESGSGLQFAAQCSEELLGRNWQRLVLTHLEEKEHKGVLTGSPITDMKITLIGGRAHQKHTEGGDFRQASYRAVRQGLKEAKSVLLEPYYEFRLEVPEKAIGRAMSDIERMHGSFLPFQSDGEMAVLTGFAPAASMNGYQKEVNTYTKGQGRLSCTLKGYEPCHNQEEIIEAMNYDPERDMENPTDSIFCAHGAGFSVKWDKVKDYRHVESQLEREAHIEDEITKLPKQEPVEEKWIGTEEIDAILERTYHANKKEKGKPTGRKEAVVLKSSPPKKQEPKEEYLLVDGYNVIFAWKELAELAEVSIDGARGRLLDILCNYQAIKKCSLIAVFDAYRVKGHRTEITDYHNIHVVYTKEAETADQYIEKFAHENGRKYRVTVATSDGLEQIIIRGQGCSLISARELQEEIRQANEGICREYVQNQQGNRQYLLDSLTEEVKEQIESIKEQDEQVK